MVKFKLLEQMTQMERRTGRRPEFTEVAKAIGVHRTTLYRLATLAGYNTTTDVVERLCDYFQCDLTDMLELMPDRGKKRAGQGSLGVKSKP